MTLRTLPYHSLSVEYSNTVLDEVHRDTVSQLGRSLG